MQEKLEKLWQQLLAMDDKKEDGSLPPYKTIESRERIWALIDKLEDAIAWIGPDDCNL